MAHFQLQELSFLCRVSGCVHILSWIWSRICHFVEVKVLKGKFLGSQKWKNKSSNAQKKIGLDENITLPATGTVMILSFQTDMPGQTVQTQIRLLLVWSGSTLFQFPLHLSDALRYVKPPCSNSRLITANFLGVRIFRNFTVNKL